MFNHDRSYYKQTHDKLLLELGSGHWLKLVLPPTSAAVESPWSLSHMLPPPAWHQYQLVEEGSSFDTARALAMSTSPGVLKGTCLPLEVGSSFLISTSIHLGPDEA